jgi:hypothetical protein
MTTAQHQIVKPQQGANRGHTYPCVHPEPVWCRLMRNGLNEKKDYNFVAVLGGCNCPCHFTNGVPVPYRAWVAPGQDTPIGTLHAIRLEKLEEQEDDASWLL